MKATSIQFFFLSTALCACWSGLPALDLEGTWSCGNDEHCLEGYSCVGGFCLKSGSSGGDSASGGVEACESDFFCPGQCVRHDGEDYCPAVCQDGMCSGDMYWQAHVDGSERYFFADLSLQKECIVLDGAQVCRPSCSLGVKGICPSGHYCGEVFNTREDLVEVCMAPECTTLCTSGTNCHRGTSTVASSCTVGCQLDAQCVGNVDYSGYTGLGYQLDCESHTCHCISATLLATGSVVSQSTGSLCARQCTGDPTSECQDVKVSYSCVSGVETAQDSMAGVQVCIDYFE